MSPAVQFSLMTFCGSSSLAADEFHVINDLMIVTISLYNCIMCGTLECEHVHFEISMVMSYVFVECKSADL
jgi:Co/Zn/Cd efflux system component